MNAKILDGKILAQDLKDDLKNEVDALKQETGSVPRLVNVTVGSEHSSCAYAKSQKSAAEYIGIEYELKTLPADPETVCLFIIFLARTCCYVTIQNYVSGLWALHDYWGIKHVDSSMFLIKSTMKGAKRLLGCQTVQAPPLFPQDMVRIWRVMNLDNFYDLQLWCAITVAYRCLLRVSHVTTSPHTLLVGDVTFTPGGMDITVRSSKTIQFRERLQVIPVVKAGNSVLCPVAYLRSYLAAAGLPRDSPLFPYTYNRFSSLFKNVCFKAGLKAKYTTHSMRRGSATFLSTFLPLHVVKTYGDWRSWAVLLYTYTDTYTTRKEKDALVASKLSMY